MNDLNFILGNHSPEWEDNSCTVCSGNPLVEGLNSAGLINFI